MAAPGTAALTSMTGGVAACKALQSCNALSSATAPPKNRHANRKQRNSVATARAAAGSGSEDGSQRRTIGLDGIIGGKGKLLVASMVSGLADVRSSLGITYDEAIGNVKAAASATSDSFDVPAVDASSLTDFLSSNPLAVAAGGAVLLLPVIVSTLFKKSEGFGTVSAVDAYTKLGDDGLAGELLDIRAGADIKSEGSPNLKAYRKKASQLPYNDEPDAFLVKALKKYSNAEETTIFVLDRFDGNSSSVAKLLAKGGFKAAYAIKDGAEGPRGWQNSDLPWLEPSKGFSINLGGIKDFISPPDTGSIVPTTLGVAAAAGVGVVVLSEAETALQLVGSAVLVQLFFKKLLFAKDRKKTVQEFRVFLDTKVAPKDIADELKGVASVLLPKFEEVKAVSVSGATTVENKVASAVTEAPTLVEDKTISSATTEKAETNSSATTEKAETKSSAATEEAGPVESPVAETPPTVESPISETSAAVDSPVNETSAPVETPSAAVETPTSAAETPAAVDSPVNETSAPVETPAATVETPTSAAETPAAVDLPVNETSPPVETPSAAVETPTSAAETPAAVDSPVNETSAPVETPSAAVETPNSAAETPAAVETPASLAETPASPAETPASPVETPASPTETPAHAETKDESPASSSSPELPRTASAEL